MDKPTPGDDPQMQEPVGEDRQVKFFFEFDPAYRLVGANGMWGGMTPRGDMRLDFFVESHVVPEHVVNLITPDGGLGPELTRSPSPRGRIIRRLQMGVLLSAEQAESVADFIKQRVAEYRQKKGKMGQSEENP